MTRDIKNILFVINALELGGAEMFLLRLIKSLKNNYGIKAYLYCLKDESKDPEFRNYFLKETCVELLPEYNQVKKSKCYIGWKFNALFLKLFNYPIFQNYLDKAKTKYFIRFCKRNNIDLINSHLLSADIFAGLYLKNITNLPWVLTSQGCYNDYENKDIVTELIRKVDGITYVAEKNLKIFFDAGLILPQNNMLIYNGLEKTQSKSAKKRCEFGITDKDFLVGQICRSIESKGMEVSINAVQKLNNEGLNNIKLMLVGPENDYYQKLRIKYKDYSNIIFGGMATNPIEFAEMFDVGILPSYFPGESCPSSIVEYLVCGKPTIATDIGEIPKMIKFNSQNGGIIVNEKSSEGIPDFNFFADAIKSYYLDKEKLAADSDIAKNAFDKFDIKETSRMYLQVYKNAITQSKIDTSINAFNK